MRRNIEVDADWTDTLLAIVGSIALLAVFAAKLWLVVRRPFEISTDVTWQTYVALSAGVILVANLLPRSRDYELGPYHKGLIFFGMVLSASAAARLVLFWTKASQETWRLAAGVLNAADLLMWAAMLAVIGWWFKEKVRIV